MWTISVMTGLASRHSNRLRTAPAIARKNRNPIGSQKTPVPTRPQATESHSQARRSPGVAALAGEGANGPLNTPIGTLRRGPQSVANGEGRESFLSREPKKHTREQTASYRLLKYSRSKNGW